MNRLDRIERTTDLKRLKTLFAINSAEENRHKIPFTWGEVIGIHSIGDYSLVEYYPWKSKDCVVLTGVPNKKEVQFSGYIKGRNLSRSWNSLEAGIAGCIAYKAEGLNSHAGDYFMKMIGLE